MINVTMKSQQNRLRPKITVIGVGGAGGNAVNNMISSNLEGCEFLVCNTDAQALEGNLSPHKIQLGVNVTRGLGAGASPDIGARAAEESLQDIMGYLEGSNMVFVTAGMGGGTGTGAAPVIAQAAREAGILTIGVVTKPFHFEGTHRMRLADGGIEELQKYVDTLIIIPNQNLFRIANEKTTFADAFKMADEVLQSGVRGVTDLMVMPGLINLDFADIRTVMAEMGKAMMGTGEAEGERRATEAAEAAISNPLLDDVSMKGARGVLINITGGYDMTLFEVDEAANRIREEVDPEANIIFGSTFDSVLDGKMRVSVVATGIEVGEARQPRSKPIAEVARRAPTGQPREMGGYAAGASFFGQPQERSSQQQSRTDVPASILPPVAQQGGFMAQPVASAAPVETPAQPTMQVGTATTASSAYAAAATARKLDDVEDEGDAWAMRPATQNIQRHGTQQQATTAAQQPRAQRHGNTFIPPRPVDPRATAPMPEMDPFVEAEIDNGVRAPSRPAVPEVKKSPSLFERFTRNRETPAVAAVETTQPQLSVQQGGNQDGDDDSDLEIPAFLRRQAN